jgi:ubiquinone/menaquinone biosynthesis C-methylase UbiE
MIAEEYILIDKVYGNYIAFEEKIKPIIANYDLNSRLNILEIGCGTGISTKIIASSRDEIILTSIDIDKDAIDFAKHSLSGYPTISFIQSDALQFVKEQQNNYFNLVVSAYTIHNLTNEYRQSLYQNIYRILKKEGLFINADKFVSTDKDEQIEGLKYRINTYIDALMRIGKIDLLKEWVTHYIDDQSPEKLLLYDNTIEVLEAIGFRNNKYIFKSPKEMLGILTSLK